MNIRRGLVLVQGVFSVLMVIFLMMVFWQVMQEFSEIDHDLERSNHRAEVNNMRMDMMETWVQGQMKFQSFDVMKVIGTNPIKLMPSPPAHYLGELRNWPDAGAVWFYDLRQQCLVYLFKNGEHEAYRLKKAGGEVGGLNIVLDHQCTSQS